MRASTLHTRTTRLTHHPLSLHSIRQTTRKQTAIHCNYNKKECNISVADTDAVNRLCVVDTVSLMNGGRKMSEAVRRCVQSNQRRYYAEIINREQMYIPPFPEHEEEILQLEEKLNLFKENVEKISQNEQPMRVVAFTNALKYDLVSFQNRVIHISRKSNPKIYNTKSRDTSFLHIKITQETAVSSSHPRSLAFLTWSGVDKDYFVFDDGVVVGWGTEEIDQQSIQMLLIVEQPIPLLKEDMIFKYGDEMRLDAENDTMVITTKDEFLQKVSCSFALARSVKLDAIEIEVEAALHDAQLLKFDSTAKYEGGMGLINKPREQLARLHKLRYNLSTRARVMEPPLFLWDKPSSFTELYETTAGYFEFNSRHRVVENKLDLPMNYWTLENDHASSVMGWRLEKMIIVLILIEVIFNILDKSENWQQASWEKGWCYIRGVPYVPRKKNLSNNPLGDEYEIVSETYEILTEDGSSLAKSTLQYEQK